MAKIGDFLKANKLKQVELARYLEITEASASRMAKGLTNPSPKNLRKIMENDRGWDTSMLLNEEKMPSPGAVGDGGCLEDMLALQKEQIRLLEKILEEKDKELTILREENKSLKKSLSIGKDASEVYFANNHDGGIIILDLHKYLQDIKNDVEEAVKKSIKK